MSQNFKACAMTMVYKDPSFLKIWVDHYGREFGRENLFVLAHGALPEVYEIAEGCNVIPLPRDQISKRFNVLRWNLMSAYASFALETYDCVVGGDVDEYLFADPQIAPDLTTYLARFKGEHAALNCFALEVFQNRGDAVWDPEKPILSQRRFAFQNVSYCKPLVAYEPINWLPGGHASNHPPVLAKGLIMAHLRFAIRRLYQETAQMKAQITEESGGEEALRGNVHTFWLRGAAFADRRCREKSALPKEEFDVAYPMLFEEIRQNVVPHKRNRNAHHFQGTGQPKFKIQLPERFGSVLAPEGITV